METIHFLGKDGTFRIEQPENYSGLYFPIAGENGIKSSVSPNLGGDIKIDQNTFLMEPVSVENLHNNRSGRNFWCQTELGAWSAVGVSAEEESKKFTESQDKSILTAGFMWQTVIRQSKKYQLEAEVTSFVPLLHNIEIMQVKVRNIGETAQDITPVAAVPIFGRSADNIRDHRHVTSLLHRIRTTENGVYVKPSLSFDERGHQKNNITYFVCGVTGSGEKPLDFYPTTDQYIGEGGSFSHPWKVIKKEAGVAAGSYLEGKEAVGGIRFSPVNLEKNECVSYTVIIGATEQEQAIEDILAAYQTEKLVEQALVQMQEYWQKKVNVAYETGNNRWDCLMRWVSFQPILRRIYGCSFLPHHDYGRGGRGWRDLWQDCLSLLIMDPGSVRQMILDNYNGVRMDGSNATIIGTKQGEFLADRNGIARIWMDHGVWPFMTTKLYIDQTGDIEILKEEVFYFKDEQVGRGSSLDRQWDSTYGIWQRTENGELYKGSVLEHLLLQHLTAFYEVGAHNHIRLRGADWNDALDMASENGESVAFTCAYAGNLAEFAELLFLLEEKFGWQQVELLEEIELLLADGNQIYEDMEVKQSILRGYLQKCVHFVSGRKKAVSILELAQNLKAKAEWIKEHIRKTEWVEGESGEGWFNSYYDNHGKAVEYYQKDHVRMMLTGQVFAIMSKTAEESQVAGICQSADHYLYQKETGGYRLNTDFGELKMDLGRMFGFAYGEKENGAVFSHMTVMYANALYRRGFIKEGYRALQTLADAALNFEVSKIYPGIPEYFNGEGRGLYHYLTGAASWYMLTVVTEVFGVHGELGNMVIHPKLMPEQLDQEGKAQIWLPFSGKRFHIIIRNPQKLEYEHYQIKRAVLDQELELNRDRYFVSLDRERILAMTDKVHTIEIEL